MSEEKEVIFMVKNNGGTAVRTDLRLFGSTKVLVLAALLIALSIVLGKSLAFNIGNSIRISLENLPILMAAVFFGPFIGAAVAVSADIIGCIMAGYAINPIITLGGACIGLIAGFLAQHLLREDTKLFPGLLGCIMPAHIVGSMLIKSVGLYIYYHKPVEVLLLRIPIYIGTGLIETYIICLLLSSKAFAAELQKVRKK